MKIIKPEARNILKNAKNTLESQLGKIAIQICNQIATKFATKFGIQIATKIDSGGAEILGYFHTHPPMRSGALLKTH